MTRRRAPKTRYTLRRNATSITKDLIWYKKTNCVSFFKTSKNNSAEFKIATNLGFIEASSVVKYLGAFFDKNLNWEAHTQFVLDKMCSAKRNIVQT